MSERRIADLFTSKGHQKRRKEERDAEEADRKEELAARTRYTHLLLDTLKEQHKFHEELMETRRTLETGSSSEIKDSILSTNTEGSVNRDSTGQNTSGHASISTK